MVSNFKYKLVFCLYLKPQGVWFFKFSMWVS
jgi:hypothetical protein